MLRGCLRRRGCKVMQDDVHDDYGYVSRHAAKICNMMIL